MAIVVNGVNIPNVGDYIKVGNTNIDKVNVVKNSVTTTVWEKVSELYPIGSPTSPSSIRYTAYSQVEDDSFKEDHTWAGTGHPGSPSTKDYTLWTGDVTNYKNITISFTYKASGYGKANAYLFCSSSNVLLDSGCWMTEERTGIKSLDISSLSGTQSIILRVYAATESSYRPYSVETAVTVKYLKLK